MALTKDFSETVKARALRDRAFREELLKESVECFLAGDTDTGKVLLRDYINATIGFEKLAKATEKSPKSLMRMFSHAGNPRADNIFAILGALQRKEGIHLQVKAVR